MRNSILFACAMLAACGSQDEAVGDYDDGSAATQAEATVADIEPSAETAPEPPEDAVTPALDAEGLRLITPSGSTRLIAFGMARRAVENAVTRAVGKAGTRSSNSECGAGPMDFSKLEGLTLNFQDDKFVGWTLQPPSPMSTIDGIELGSTRAGIEETRAVEMVEDSTLGAEFSTGGLGGFFDGEGGTVSLLYAGTQCFFR